MIFLGTTFFGGRHTMDPQPTNASNIHSFTLREGSYDHFYVSKNPAMDATNIYDNWNYDTALNAFFESTLDAGNVGFSLKSTDRIVIRMREAGSYDWHVVKTIDIVQTVDFDFTFIYKYCRNNTWYEFAIVSTCGNIENCSVSQLVYSSFDGLFVMDASHTYGSVFDVRGFDTTRNISTEVINLLHHKYASVYANSDAAYESGSARASFIELENCRTLMQKEGRIRREEVLDFLCNHRPKVIKSFDGRIWMIQITGTPTDSSEANPLIRQLAFDWTQIGDVYNTKDMSRHGLLDVAEYWRGL